LITREAAVPPPLLRTISIAKRALETARAFLSCVDPRLSHFDLSSRRVATDAARLHDEIMNKVTVQDLSTKRAAIVTRAVDAVDRAHARAAMMLHEARNRARDAAERGLDRMAAAIDGARDRVKQIDARSADLVNRAQGVVGHALERARPPAPTATA
jgi:hypothetical protein